MTKLSGYSSAILIIIVNSYDVSLFSALIFPIQLMNYWNILDWNIRGINSQNRWDDIRQRINESNCNIICLQETKREYFDHSYLRNFGPNFFFTFQLHSLYWQFWWDYHHMEWRSIQWHFNQPRHSSCHY
jgi:hypothetical protein